jgi:hypothetical protein
VTNCQRLRRYREQVRETQADRDPEFPLRQRAGLNKQATLHRLPIPRHKALVPIQQ